jgi:hypothetical protein
MKTLEFCLKKCHCFEFLLFFFKATGIVFIVLILVACSSSPAEIEVVNGTPTSATAKVGVRFDTGLETYQLLPEGKEQILLEGYEIEGEGNLLAENPVLKVSLERVEENRGDSKVSYDLYYINAAVSLVVPENTPRGTHTITLKFPTVLEVRDVLKAYTPASVPSIQFTVTNYETLEGLAHILWPRYLSYAAGILLVTLIVMAWSFSDDNEGWGILALLIGGLAFLFFAAKSVWNMWIVSPCFAIIFILLLLIAVPRRVKNLFD